MARDTASLMGQNGLDAAPSAAGDPPALASLATVQTMANYLNTGYWAYSGYQGTSPRHWGAGATVTYNIEDLDATEQTMAIEALRLYSDIANINFSRTFGAGQITFNNNGSGIASTPHTVSGTAFTSATIQISSNWSGGGSFGTYRYQTYLHELGHALGLGHQGPYNNSATYGIDNIYTNDSWQLAVMSYFDQSEAGTGSYAYVTTPQFVDIQAMQDAYGARSARTGDTVYGFNSNAGTSYNFSSVSGTPAFTIYDSGGTDTLDASGFSMAQTIDLRSGPAFFSSIGGETKNIGIWTNSVVENAVGGTGSDIFYGNSSNNSLSGNSGFDTVVFSGVRSAYSFTEGSFYTATATGQGTDTLTSIEQFQFSDITVTDDYRGATSTLGFLTVNSAQKSGDMQFYGDRDWFAVQLNAGQNYVIHERGAATSSGTLSDPLVRLYNSAGVELIYNDDGGYDLDSELAIHVTTSGTYYVGASVFAGLGTYSVAVETTEATRFENGSLIYSGFGAGAAGGSWVNNDLYTRRVADVNGDHRDDVIGFGYGGVYIATASNALIGGLGTTTLAYAGFGAGASAGGWTSDNIYHREVVDVNNDNLADIVGFASNGVYVALNTGTGTFAAATLKLASFGPEAGGWSSQDLFHREVADVTGDGQADIVGFGGAGVYVAAGTGGGNFANPTLALHGYGTDAGAGSWSSDNLYPRRLADVNGDGRMDIVGFGDSAVYVSLATGSGTNAQFGATLVALNAFGAGAAGGSWTDQNIYSRILGDINNDGRADIVAFGDSGVYYALGQSNGTFGAVTADLVSYGAASSAGGWVNASAYPRMLGDIDGDGRKDIVAFGDAGTFLSRSFDFQVI